MENKYKFKIKSLIEVDLSHGTKYLNTLTELENAYDTVKDAERTLTKFYVYLSDKVVISHILSNEFELVEGEFYSFYKSPFQNVIYPSIEKVKSIECTLPYGYIPLFLEIVNLVEKPIALRVYLQFFGGLRVGEIVNLKRTQLQRSVSNGYIYY